MSLSKVAPNCVFCKSGSGIYTCPRCNKKYCSSYCYKCRLHAECSEAFYKGWVEETLSSKSSDPADRENMFRILKNFEAASAEDDEELSMEERFAGLDIDKADENVIWQHLSQEERLKFKSLIETESDIGRIVSVKQPWWTQKTLNLVSEDTGDSNANCDVTSRPPYPLNAKKLSELTSAVPSDCIQNNLVNVLYCYSYLFRFYNGDLRDFLEEVVELIFVLSPVLSEGHNYLSLEEALQDSIRKLITSDPKAHIGYVKSIVRDLGTILQGPSNSRACTFVLCALHDIKLLFLNLKEKSKQDKNLKKRLLLAVKKIEYYISWSLEYEAKLVTISSDVGLVMLPDLIPDSNQTIEKTISVETKKKSLIEEIN